MNPCSKSVDNFRIETQSQYNFLQEVDDSKKELNIQNIEPYQIDQNDFIFHNDLIGVTQPSRDYKILRSYITLNNGDRIFHTQIIPEKE